MKSKQKMLLLLAFIFCLSGCKNDTSSERTDLTGQSLTVISPFGQGDGYQTVYLQLLNAFQDDTGCTVNDYSERSSEKWKLDVLNAFDNDTEPDVIFFFAGTDANDLIQNKKVVDLDTIRQYDPHYAMHINLSVLNTMKAADGLNYCVPVTGFWEGLYINKDLFDAHNVAIPTTMDALLEAVQTFREAQIIPIAANLQTTPHYWFEYMLYNYTGPSNHNENINKDMLADAMRNSFQTLKTLYESGAFPPDIRMVTDDASTALFVEKNAAMMLDGSWAAGSIQDKENVQVVHVPMIGNARKETDIIGGFSMGYYITEKAWNENKEAAVAFVKAMTGEEALTIFNANGSASPGPKHNTGDTTAFVKSTESFINSATAFVPALQDTFDKDAREYLFSHFLDILTGEINADTVMDEFFILNQK